MLHHLAYHYRDAMKWFKAHIVKSGLPKLVGRVFTFLGLNRSSNMTWKTIIRQPVFRFQSIMHFL